MGIEVYNVNKSYASVELALFNLVNSEISPHVFHTIITDFNIKVPYKFSSKGCECLRLQTRNVFGTVFVEAKNKGV